MVLVFFRKITHKCLDLEENVCTHLVRIPNACIGNGMETVSLEILTVFQGRHAVFALELFAQVGRSEAHFVGNG